MEITRRISRLFRTQIPPEPNKNGNHPVEEPRRDHRDLGYRLGMHRHNDDRKFALYLAGQISLLEKHLAKQEQPLTKEVLQQELEHLKLDRLNPHQALITLTHLVHSQDFAHVPQEQTNPPPGSQDNRAAEIKEVKLKILDTLLEKAEIQGDERSSFLHLHKSQQEDFLHTRIKEHLK